MTARKEVFTTTFTVDDFKEGLIIGNLIQFAGMLFLETGAETINLSMKKVDRGVEVTVDWDRTYEPSLIKTSRSP